MREEPELQRAFGGVFEAYCREVPRWIPRVAVADRSRLRGAGNPGSSAGATRWSSHSSRSGCCCSSGAASSSAASSRCSRSTPASDASRAAILTFLTPATRFTPDEARVYTRRLLDRFRERARRRGDRRQQPPAPEPLSTRTSDFNVAGFEPPGDHGAFIADRAEVDPGFFEAAGIEILRGRNFSDADRPDTQPVVIISEAMARHFWADGDAVGRQVRRRDDDGPPWLVVGVASDAKVRTLGEAPRNMVYLPYS